MTDFIRASGVIARGHRVASGLAADSRFPNGTIAPQLRFFEQRLPGFTASFESARVFPGTINLRFEGRRVILRSPEHHLTGVAWTDCFPPENFYLSRALLAFGSRQYPAYLYVPDPTTKPDHHQPGDIIELLSGFVPDLDYGMPADLLYAPSAIAIV